MMFNAKSLNARTLTGVAVLSVMVVLAAWATRHFGHHDDAGQKVGYITIEGL